MGGKYRVLQGKLKRENMGGGGVETKQKVFEMWKGHLLFHGNLFLKSAIQCKQLFSQ